MLCTIGPVGIGNNKLLAAVFQRRELGPANITHMVVVVGAQILPPTKHFYTAVVYLKLIRTIEQRSIVCFALIGSPISGILDSMGFSIFDK